MVRALACAVALALPVMAFRMPSVPRGRARGAWVMKGKGGGKASELQQVRTA
jgi:hypothetical protein